jgi:hypothetical protein
VNGRRRKLGFDLTEIAGTAGQQRKRACANQAKEERLARWHGLTRSAAAATAAWAGLRLLIARTVGRSFDANDWQDDHSRRFGRGADIFAAARAGVFRKADHFTHDIPLTTPRFSPALAGTLVFLPPLKRRQG